MRRPPRDTLLGIALLLVGIALLVVAHMAWGRPPVSAIVAQAAHDYAPQGWPEPQFRKALAGIIWVESRNCANRIGDHGRAFGCCELHMVAVVQVLGASVPYWLAMMNDSFNIRVGAMYLAYCFKQTGTPAAAILCFNWGPSSTRGLTSAALRRNPYVTAVLLRGRRGRLLRARLDMRPERGTVSVASR